MQFQESDFQANYSLFSLDRQIYLTDKQAFFCHKSSLMYLYQGKVVVIRVVVMSDPTTPSRG
jgi:hypothetical protein